MALVCTVLRCSSKVSLILTGRKAKNKEGRKERKGARTIGAMLPFPRSPDWA